MFLLSILVLSAGCALAHAQYDMIPPEVLFERFIQDYNKVYRNHHEKQMRFEIFKDTLRKINESNRKHGYGVMGINHFADLTREEFRRKLGLDYELRQGSSCSKGKINTSFEPPESFDWRDKGVVADVKDQENCGSCWAFSTISNIESQYAIKHGNMVQLSEQQLVDCDDDDLHCNGGSMDVAIEYLMKTGAVSEEDYPYEGATKTCRLDTSKVVVNVTGCTDYSIQSANDEETLKAVLVQNGPLTIALAAGPFMFYTGGVFEDCDEAEGIDHALVLEGYGTDQATGKPYWIIRNSWGSSWGEDGYLRIVRGNPACQVGQHLVVSGQVA